MDKDLRRKLNFLPIAIQYYVSGRSAAKYTFMPVCGNLFHNAVEMLLKTEVTGRHTHKLKSLWKEFKKNHNNLDHYDSFIEKLHKWEEIRYPDVTFSRAMSVGRHKPEKDVPILKFEKTPDFETREYHISLEEVDEFFKEIWNILLLNRDLLNTFLITPTSKEAYEEYNKHLI